MKPTALIIALGLVTTIGASAEDFGRKTTVETAKGSAARHISGTVTPGVVNRSATTTGPAGRSAQGSQQIVRTGQGRASSGTYTGPGGKTATTNGSVTFSEGARTAVRSVTGPNGQTKGFTTTTTKTKN